MSTTLLNQENIIKKVYDPTTEALTVTGSVTTTPPVGASTEAKQDVGNASLTSIDAKVSKLEVYKVTTLIDTSITNISNVTYLTVEASTAQVTRKIISIDDIGEYMELFTGPASSEVKLCALPLGGGEVEVNVPAGTRLSIKSLGPVVSSGNIIFNLLK